MEDGTPVTLLRFALSSTDPFAHLYQVVAPTYVFRDDDEDPVAVDEDHDAEWYYAEVPSAVMDAPALVELGTHQERVVRRNEREADLVASRLLTRFQHLRPRYSINPIANTSPQASRRGTADDVDATATVTGADGHENVRFHEDGGFVAVSQGPLEDDNVPFTNEDLEEMERAHIDLSVEERTLAAFASNRPSFAELAPALRLYPWPFFDVPMLDHLFSSLVFQYVYLLLWCVVVLVTFYGEPTSVLVLIVLLLLLLALGTITVLRLEPALLRLLKNQFEAYFVMLVAGCIFSVWIWQNTGSVYFGLQLIWGIGLLFAFFLLLCLDALPVLRKPIKLGLLVLFFVSAVRVV
jgi:hypothetical protein